MDEKQRWFSKLIKRGATNRVADRQGLPTVGALKAFKLKKEANKLMTEGSEAEAEKLGEMVKNEYELDNKARRATRSMGNEGQN